MNYNTGNYEKHTTQNPLKRIMVNRLDEHIISDLKRMIDSIEGEVSILDAGCGEGFTISLLLENISNIKITGLEYTEEALSVAKQMNPNIKIIQGDITNMQFNDNQFDIVLCSEVLEHIINPEKALNELNRVAKRFVYITVPNEPWFSLGNLIVLKNVRRLGNPIDHVKRWSKHSFNQFLEQTISGGGYWRRVFRGRLRIEN